MIAEIAFAPGMRLGDDTPLPSGSSVYAFELDFKLIGRTWQAIGGSYRRLRLIERPN